MKILLILFIILISACGVKGPPRPPLSAEQEVIETAKEKEHEEKRQKQLKAIAAQNEKEKNKEKK